MNTLTVVTVASLLWTSPIPLPPVDPYEAQSGVDANEMMSGYYGQAGELGLSSAPLSAGFGGVLVALLAATGIFFIANAFHRHRITLASRLRNVRQPQSQRDQRVPRWLQRRWMQVVEAIGSTSASVERRLELLGGAQTLAHFRLQQVIATLVSMATLGAATALVMARLTVSGFVSVLLSLAIGALAGAALWDQLLTARAQRRQRLIDSQVPDMSDLLALAVGAGESIPGALSRVSQVTASELAGEISRTVSELTLGRPTSQALSQLAERNDSPSLSRLCQTMVTAIERGSPLALVLHDQAQDIREHNRQRLLEEGGKREIVMLFPVVFLILPITILFALYPGLAALKIGP
ncbi:type II secretion system F family protein [Schaalia canis]|uniref:Type II secretion system F family protein n=1 Tax=Schaalia canis TaxID=100469 RepID=A0A3P1SE01_9ACTO|nr:type II secretion system F family protein [Schaalia canis]RRC95239.1 type II secretion system F family protein [Schaalia canis]